MKKIELLYQAISICPLCGGDAHKRDKLTRANYFFGVFCIPLPSEGVYLLECTVCSLLFKSAVPSQESLSIVMAGGATAVWQSKSGVHPALAWVLPHLKNQHKSVLDVGASNGDLLAQVKPFASGVSALDVVEYPQCRLVVDREYIIGEIEGELNWSGEQYDIVTAFDIFEHFLNTKAALRNISATLKRGGKLIVETGDWNCYSANLGEWYYANLFEHQIFWNRKSFDYLCSQYGFSILEYRHCQHKGRRNLRFYKRLAMELVVKLAKAPQFQKLMLAIGKGDPLRFAAPALVDHAFVVLEKSDE